MISPTSGTKVTISYAPLRMDSLRTPSRRRRRRRCGPQLLFVEVTARAAVKLVA
jgi:hypothetical protein